MIMKANHDLINGNDFLSLDFTKTKNQSELDQTQPIL